MSLCLKRTLLIMSLFTYWIAGFQNNRGWFMAIVWKASETHLLHFKRVAYVEYKRSNDGNVSKWYHNHKINLLTNYQFSLIVIIQNKRFIHNINLWYNESKNMWLKIKVWTGKERWIFTINLTYFKVILITNN